MSLAVCCSAGEAHVCVQAWCRQVVWHVLCVTAHAKVGCVDCYQVVQPNVLIPQRTCQQKRHLKTCKQRMNSFVMFLLLSVLTALQGVVQHQQHLYKHGHRLLMLF